MKPQPVKSRYYRTSVEWSLRYSSARIAWAAAILVKRDMGISATVYRVDVLETWTPVRRPRIQRGRKR